MKNTVWTGTISGTNFGNVFLILEHEGNNVSGTLTINDINFGVADYKVRGTFNNRDFMITGTPTNSTNMASIANNIVHGSILVEGKLSEGIIKGQWSSSLKTRGVFSIEEQVL